MSIRCRRPFHSFDVVILHSVSFICVYASFCLHLQSDSVAVLCVKACFVGKPFMTEIESLLFTPTITQSLLVLTLVITLGLWLGEHARIGHFSLGVTWVLFIGIAVSALGISIKPDVARFANDFGLILFVYAIGLQVGPSFAPFKRGGLRLNLLATAFVLLGCLVTIALHYITGLGMDVLDGVLAGATASTPALAAVQQACSDVMGHISPDIATGYAVAYPLSIVGTIIAFELLRLVFRVRLPQEEESLQQETRESDKERPVCVDITLHNPQIDTMTVSELLHICPIKQLIVSRVIRPDGTDELVSDRTSFGNGDTIRVLTDRQHLDSLRLLGTVRNYSFSSKENSDHLISRRIAVTRPECNGKRIASFNLRSQYHATITRVNRAGIDLLATPDLVLQLGDRLVVVGDRGDVQRVADTFGNELKRLDLPNLLPIFFGIFMGILLGILPIPIPGLNQTFRLGLAGGTLIVALLIGRFGPYYNMVTFATTSANMMLRQVGLTLFLAALGLEAGEHFVPTIMAGGYMWVLYGFIITMVPLLIVGAVAYKGMHLNYFKVMGLLAGAMTAAPALAYAESMSSRNDQASVCYATVYPFTTFLRVMAAQLLIIFFCG